MASSSDVIIVPKWTYPLRALQIFFSIVILGLSGYGVYWIHFGSWGFAIFTCIATWIIIAYILLTSLVGACRGAYNYWAIIALESISVIFWLSSMAALAATRATFTVPTTIDGCVHTDGGGICDKKRDLSGHLVKRTYVATYSYLNMMSAAAGLSALEMTLFIATLAVFSVHVHRHRTSHSVLPTSDKVDGHEMHPQAFVAQTTEYQSQYPQQYAQTYAPAYSAHQSQPQQYVTQQYYDPPVHQQ
ncbi:hypothetical protein F5884DRAFT_41091 [Xylogone sp. PMI_703]|nr:hypothetical protein F5884DRAFT_41091 [Xylogone sp. PMI_703]